MTNNELRYIQLATKTCEICGASFQNNNRLEIHHRDRDRSNNSPGNTIILCRGCHIKLHHPRQWENQAVVAFRNKGFTFAHIGEIMGISRQRVHQIYKKSPK